MLKLGLACGRGKAESGREKRVYRENHQKERINMRHGLVGIRIE